MHGSFTHGARGGLSGEKTWKKRSGGEFLLLRATVGFALEASDGLDEAHSRCGRFTPQQLAHGAAHICLEPFQRRLGQAPCWAE